MKDINSEMADITDRDNALFEAGIKLGALYHQFTGSPISIANVSSMEKAIQESILAQPFVESISVEINQEKVIAETNETFMYTELKGSMLNVKAVIRFSTVRAFVSLKMNEELKYPLMQIDKIEEGV